MAVSARSQRSLRSFDMSSELRAIAAERGMARRPPESSSTGGVADIAAPLAEQFPTLPADTVTAIVSELFRGNVNCSRQQLRELALAALLRMASDAGQSSSVASFEPPSISSADAWLLVDSALADLLSLPEDELHACATTLSKVLSHIEKQPDEPKFRQLKLSNPRFASEVGRHDAAVGLLKVAGFEEAMLEDGAKVLIFSGQPDNSFAQVAQGLEACLATLRPSNDSKPVEAKDLPKALPKASSPEVDRRSRIAALTELRLKDPRAFREEALRQHGNSVRVVGSVATRPTSASSDVTTRPTSASSDLTVRRSRHFTLADIDRMRVQEEIASTPSYADEYKRLHQSTPAGNYRTLVDRSYDPELIARQALDGTNRYRASKNLPPLRWHDGIARIAREHAEQMASGQATFSHDGFDKRVAAFPVVQRAAAENLALNSGVSEVAAVAVDGWIKSPGHEKNLRGAFNLCGIGVARSSNGTFYLTQLFAHAL